MKFHVRENTNNWPKSWKLREFTFEVKDEYGSFTVYKVFDGDKLLGHIERIANHRTYQVHGRIRYDNKPRTAWQAQSPPRSPNRHLIRDTRVWALVDMLGLGYGDIHTAHQRPMWMSCDLCALTKAGLTDA